MDFLKDLSEAQLIGRSRSGLTRFNARELADLLFLHLLGLQILKYEFYGLPEAKKYVQGVGPLTNVDNFIGSRNEIYMMLHVLFGKRGADASRALLKDPEANTEFFKQIHMDFPLLRKYFGLIRAGKNDAAFERRFLLAMEHYLNINNQYYRAIRRLAMTWDRQSESTRRLVMTRLLQIMRSKARRSEMMGMLEYLSKKEKLEKPDLEPLEGEGVGQNIQSQPKKSMGFMKGLALGTAAFAGGAYLGHKLTSKQ